MTTRRISSVRRASLALALVLTASLAGACGDKASTSTDASTTEAASVAAIDSTPAEAALTAPAEPARTGDSKPGTPGSADTSPVVAVTNPAVNVSETPGQSDDNFVGAASDVKQKSCKQDGKLWKATGTVTNSSGADASYRIYVAFNEAGTTNTKALAQVNKDVADGKTDEWSIEAEANGDLICILRVERTKSK